MRSFKRLFLFAIVGVAGFVVDTVVLYIVRGFAGLYFGRLLSFVTAVFTTWVLNRNLTFRDRVSGTSIHSEFAIYIALMLCGGLVNYGVYAALVSRYESINASPVIGVAAGSLAGMFINLVSSRFLLFRFDRRELADRQGGRERRKDKGGAAEQMRSALGAEDKQV